MGYKIKELREEKKMSKEIYQKNQEFQEQLYQVLKVGALKKRQQRR